jgi:hypothetical protein
VRVRVGLSFDFVGCLLIVLSWDCFVTSCFVFCLVVSCLVCRVRLQVRVRVLCLLT